MGSCCFCGHRDVGGADVKKLIKAAVTELIENEEVTLFLLGNYGRFDAAAASVLKELKKEYPHIRSALVIPYITREIEAQKEYYASTYDEIIIAEIDENVPPSIKIIKSNEYTVKKSDYMVCFIDHKWGGAYRTYTYAKRRNLEIINLSKSGV